LAGRIPYIRNFLQQQPLLPPPPPPLLPPPQQPPPQPVEAAAAMMSLRLWMERICRFYANVGVLIFCAASSWTTINWIFMKGLPAFSLVPLFMMMSSSFSDSSQLGTDGRSWTTSHSSELARSLLETVQYGASSFYWQNPTVSGESCVVGETVSLALSHIEIQYTVLAVGQ